MRRRFILNSDNENELSEISEESKTIDKNIYHILAEISRLSESEGEALKLYFKALDDLFESYEDEIICECDYLFIKNQIEIIIAEEEKHNYILMSIIESLSKIKAES